LKSFLYSIYIVIFFASQSIFSQEAKAIFSYPEFVEGFNITAKKGYKILEIKQINTPYNKTSHEQFVLVHRDSVALINSLKKQYKNVIRIPAEKIIVTSTTHLPGIDMLQSSEKVIGFPGTDFISSASFRSLIKKGKLKEMGQQEQLNLELVLAAAPELIIGYAVGEIPKLYKTLVQSGIPVILNHDWLAQHPLGKASWIYLYGALFDKLDQADQLFKTIHDQYNDAKKLAAKALTTPTVFSGAMYKDVWYAPGGKSWAAQFIKDANGSYIFNNHHTGSDSYGIEYVLTQAAYSDFWIGPAQYTSYREMLKSSFHYSQFKAFKHKKIFSYSSNKGATGGVLYYELAPQRPDLVLKDLIAILHPDLLPNHSFTFFKKLDD
jgi:iron complex transport system substrate-binding protein